jgi:hypothetical protein
MQAVELWILPTTRSTSCNFFTIQSWIVIAESAFENSVLCTARMIAVSACSLSSAVIDSFFYVFTFSFAIVGKAKTTCSEGYQAIIF